MRAIWDFLAGMSSAGRATGVGGYPNTFMPRGLLDRERGAARSPNRPEFFEPALRHFSRAFRLGDPVFADAATGARWHAARRRAAEHVLRLMTRSPWAGHLVLRGSFLMRAWFGHDAREPRDLDWVVRPHTVGIADTWSRELMNGLVQLVADHPAVPVGADGTSDLITFHPDSAAVDDIWTYDRVPGRRVLLPWRCHAGAELPPGAVQIDVVFGENVWTPPVRRVLPGDLRHPADAVLWSADVVQSLAWKLQWLATDQYPQGKDLYDATLLAERATVPLAPLRAMVAAADADAARGLTADSPMQWDVQWDDFVAEYPWVDGTLEQWQTRLATALRPALAGAMFK